VVAFAATVADTKARPPIQPAAELIDPDKSTPFSSSTLAELYYQEKKYNNALALYGKAAPRLKEPAVANAAVVPKPDKERGAVVKAFVVLSPGHVGDAALISELQAHVKGRLAPYEYPKEIEFIEALPMTTTGKVQRRVLRLQEEERAKEMSSRG